MRKIKKLIASGLAVFCMSGITAAASTSDFGALSEAIQSARIRYEEACEALQAVNSKLYQQFVERMYPDEEYYRIQTIYNEKHKSEYFEYISAKMDLDDLLSLCFVATMNDVCNKVENSQN